MRIFTQRIPDQPPQRMAAEAMPLKPGVWGIRFGNERLLFSDEPPSPPVATRGARIPSRDEAVTREELHVIVQTGRLFQQHHPEVPVLHDRGRFLLVALDPGKARELGTEAKTCYGVMPVTEEQVVFETRAPAAARAPVPFVQELAGQATQASASANLTKLVSFVTRHSTSSGFNDAVMFARQKLEDLAYATKLQTVAVNGKSSTNIIADKKGNGTGKRDVIIATAHLDSINIAGGPSAPAPGADDNATGSAGVLEIARAFRNHKAVHDLRLILFGGEEEGLFGSLHYVASLTGAERARIKAVVNMDMIGSLNNAAPRAVLLEGAALSQGVIDKLADAASTYTQLSVETSLNPFNSDHVPFIEKGLPAVLTIEGPDSTNDRVHSVNDTLDHVDIPLMLDILRMNIAFIAGEIGQAP